MRADQLVQELRSSHDTAQNYVADCIEDYAASWTEERHDEAANEACRDLIAAAQGALSRMAVSA